MSPSRAWPLRVQDIIDAIREIRGFCAGQTFDDFRTDAKTIKAVLADFAIIGEAAAHVPDDIRIAHSPIAWQQMRGMRNVIIHVYFGVDLRRVWETIQNDLPVLERQLLTSFGDAPPLKPSDDAGLSPVGGRHFTNPTHYAISRRPGRAMPNWAGSPQARARAFVFALSRDGD